MNAILHGIAFFVETAQCIREETGILVKNTVDNKS